MKKKFLRKHIIFLYSIVLIGGLLLYPLFEGTRVSAQEENEPCPEPYIKTISPRVAMPGDEVKIRGRRFGNEKGEVTFSPEIKAEITQWSNNRVHVIIPESAETGSVTVSIPCGKISNSVHFTVKNTGEKD